MKQNLTLACILASFSSFAQPTLQYADFPTAELTLNWYLLTDPGSITEPSDGVGQTWDFTSAIWQLAGTVSITPAAGTLYASQFPDANWVFITTPTGQASIYAYLLADASGIQAICGDAPMNTEVYTDYKRVLQFPFSYTSSFTDTNDGTQGPDGETWSYTGSGLLQTSLGDFANTVKTVRTDDGRISLWNSAPVFPRITGNSEAVNLYTAGTAGVAEQGLAASLRVFPTSTTNELTITGLSGISQWAVLDASGRSIRTGSTAGQAVQQLDVSALAPGQYLLAVIDDGSSRTARFNKF